MASPDRVLITGGMGFVGSHLAEALLAAGHRVTVLDDLSTGQTENLSHLDGDERLRCVVGTVGDQRLLTSLVGESDVVYHLAAAVGVRLIVEEPIRSLQTNVLGTEAVLDAASRHGVKVLVASTSEVYGKSDRVPFREDDDVVIGPTVRNRWAYAAAKMVDEFLALAYAQQRGLPVVVFRLFNTVGPRQTGRYGMVIPRFVGAALEGKPLTVYGDGRQSRCFLHVVDAVEAIQQLAACPQAEGRVFNVGSTEEVSIRDLAVKVLREACGAAPPERITYLPYEQAYPAGFEDVRVRVPDVSRIERITGWRPTRDLDSILRDVISSVRPRAEAT
jgi:UDP-glucose 4-epimerase